MSLLIKYYDHKTSIIEISGYLVPHLGTFNKKILVHMLGTAKPSPLPS